MNEKDLTKKLQDRIDVLQDSLRLQESSFKERIEEIIKAKGQETDREVRLVKQKLKEKDKRLESVKINADERLTLVLESKEKEIREL